MNLKYSVFIVIIALFPFFTATYTLASENDTLPELGIYEHLNNYISPDITLYNEDSVKVDLGSIIDKPTVFVPVYYECPGLCSPLLEGVAEVIDRAKIDLGKDYRVVTFSFEPNETPALAKKKRKNYLKLLKHTNGQFGWHFYTGDQKNISKLLDEFGYKVKKEGDNYIHPGAIIIVSPKRKITRYLHGTYFLPFDLKMAVVEASDEKSGPTINKMLKFCFAYDAKGKTYVMNFTKVSGAIVLFFALILLSALVFSKKRKRTLKGLKNNG